MECRVCGSNQITRSHRRGIEKMFRYVYPRSPFRCKECWSRFWAFDNPLKTTPSKIIGGLVACLILLLIALPFFVTERAAKTPITFDTPAEKGTSAERRPGRRNVNPPPVGENPEAPEETPGPEMVPGEKPEVPAEEYVVMRPEPAVPEDVPPPADTPVVTESGGIPEESPDLPAESYLVKRQDTAAPEETRSSAETMPDTAAPPETVPPEAETDPDTAMAPAAEKAAPAEPGSGDAETSEAPVTEQDILSRTVPASPAEPSAASEEDAPAVATPPAETSPAETSPPKTPVVVSPEPVVEAPELSSLRTADEEPVETPGPDAAATSAAPDETAATVPPAPVEPAAETPGAVEPVPEKAEPVSEASTTPAPSPSPEPPAAKSAPEQVVRPLQGFDIETGEGTFTLRMQADGPVAAYRSFFLGTPPKFVVDLKGKWRQRTRSIIPVKSDLVKRVRVGEHPDFIRVVMDLYRDEPLNPVFETTPRGLQLRLQRESNP